MFHIVNHWIPYTYTIYKATACLENSDCVLYCFTGRVTIIIKHNLKSHVNAGNDLLYKKKLLKGNVFIFKMKMLKWNP